MKKALSFLLGLALCVNLSAQTKTISGRVVDKASEPVIGASVIELGTAGNGTITDIDGNFSLKINTGNNIQVSYIGYKSRIFSLFFVYLSCLITFLDKVNLLYHITIINICQVSNS